jgi:hypothetical protein
MALSDVEDFLRGTACKQSLEGIVSKRLDRPYLPGDRGAGIKTMPQLGRVRRRRMVSPEGSRPYIGPSCSVTSSRIVS